MYILLVPTKGIIGMVKDGLTTSMFYKPPDIKTVSQALEIKRDSKRLKEFRNPKELNLFEKAARGFKVGHGIGVMWLFTVILGEYAIKKLELDENSLIKSLIRTNLPFGTVGGIISFLIPCFASNPAEEKAKTKLDMFVERFIVDEKGKGKSVIGKEERDFPDFHEDVIMEGGDKERLIEALENAESEGRGGVFLMRGITRCGKTMTAKAITRYLASKHPSKKAQFWYATRAAMDRSLGDSSTFLKELLGSETTDERLERLLSYAILEDQPVVILLDEAHLLLGSGGHGYDPNDPNQSNSVVEGLKVLISEKLRTKNCKNIYFFLTCNSSGRAISVPLRNRMDFDRFFDRPKFEGRKLKIRKTLEEKLKSVGSKIKFIPDEIAYMAGFEKGNKKNRYEANLREEYGMTTEGNEKLEYMDSVLAGFGGVGKILEKRPLLQYEELEKIIKQSVNKCNRGGGIINKENLIKTIVKALDEEFRRTLESREWEGEIMYYFGHQHQGTGSGKGPNVTFSVN